LDGPQRIVGHDAGDVLELLVVLGRSAGLGAIER
jgi:hypothetical protein